MTDKITILACAVILQLCGAFVAFLVDWRLVASLLLFAVADVLQRTVKTEREKEPGEA